MVISELPPNVPEDVEPIRIEDVPMPQDEGELRNAQALQQSAETLAPDAGHIVVSPEGIRIYEELYKAHHSEIVTFVRCKFWKYPDPEGAAQEAFLRLYARPAVFDPAYEGRGYQPNASKKGWLITTVTHFIIDQNRRVTNAYGVEVAAEELPVPPATDRTVETLLDQMMLEGLLEAVIRRQAEDTPGRRVDHKEAYEWMMRIYGKSATVEELAEELGINPNTIKSKTLRLRTAMRNEYLGTKAPPA